MPDPPDIGEWLDVVQIDSVSDFEDNFVRRRNRKLRQTTHHLVKANRFLEKRLAVASRQRRLDYFAFGLLLVVSVVWMWADVFHAPEKIAMILLGFLFGHAQGRGGRKDDDDST